MSHVKLEASAPLAGPESESVIDVLLLIRQEFGRLQMYIGEPQVFALNGFIQGYRLCLSKRGNMDDRYYRFREWLRETRQEFPPEGSCTHFLRDSDGDHLLAIRKFMDRVDEFHTQVERCTEDVREGPR